MVLLEVKNVSKRFGGLQAVKDVSFTVNRGCIKAVIGPNGAGKTTLFNLVSGFLCPDAGTITYQGVPISGKDPYEIAAYGLSRTFQHIKLFAHMTVLENVMVGRHCRTRWDMLGCALRWPGQLREERAIRAAALAQLEFVDLAHLAAAPAGAFAPAIGDHTFRINNEGVSNAVRTCGATGCHPGLTTTDRVIPYNLVDYDGDGILEGINQELDGLKTALINLFAAQGIYYNPAVYPYFHNVATGQSSSTGYTNWTQPQLKAAFNLNTFYKEPGAFAHNGKYAAQILIDSFTDLNGGTLAGSALQNAQRP